MPCVLCPDPVHLILLASLATFKAPRLFGYALLLGICTPSLIQLFRVAAAVYMSTLSLSTKNTALLGMYSSISDDLLGKELSADHGIPVIIGGNDCSGIIQLQ